MASELEEELNEQGKAKKGKGFKLPKLNKLPKLPKLPKVKLPRLDLRWLLLALFVAFITVLNTVLVIRFSGPKLILKDPRMQSFAEEGEKVDEHRGTTESGKLPRNVLAPSMINRFNMVLDLPEVDPTAYLHRQAFVTGAVEIGPECYVGPQASVRGDIGQGIRVGKGSNIQDGAVIAGLPTEEGGEVRQEDTVLVGKRSYSVFLGDQVSIAPQAQVHGPAVVEEGAYLGMQTLVFRSFVGKGSVLEPRSAAIGVRIPENRYVPAGLVLREQSEADRLPVIPAGYPYRERAERNLKVHVELARAMRGK